MKASFLLIVPLLENSMSASFLSTEVIVSKLSSLVHLQFQCAVARSSMSSAISPHIVIWMSMQDW